MARRQRLATGFGRATCTGTYQWQTEPGGDASGGEVGEARTGQVLVVDAPAPGVGWP